MTHIEYPVMTLPDGDKRFRSLQIDNSGNLVFEQTDIGLRTSQIAPNGGDSDYEYWVTVEPKKLHNVLLELIRDNFDGQGDFEKWLKKKKIEYKFYSY